MLLVLLGLALSREQQVDPVLLNEDNDLGNLGKLLEETLKHVEENAKNFGSVQQIENHKKKLKELITKADETIAEISKSDIPIGNVTIIPLKIVDTKVIDYNQDLITTTDSKDINTTVLFGKRGSINFVPVLSKLQSADGWIFAPSSEAIACTMKDFDVVFYLRGEKKFKGTYEYTPSDVVSMKPFGQTISFDRIKLKAKSTIGNDDKVCIGKFDLYKTEN